MSLYRLHLFVMTELSSKEALSFYYENKNIHFHFCNKKNKWIIKTKIVSFTSSNYKKLKENFINQKHIAFSLNSFLLIDSIDGYGIYLIHEAADIKKYTIFSTLMRHHLEEQTTWQEILA